MPNPTTYYEHKNDNYFHHTNGTRYSALSDLFQSCGVTYVEILQSQIMMNS